MRFYQGVDSGREKRGAVAVTRGAQSHGDFLGRSLPGVSEQAAAVALATFRSMSRAPEVKMAWASSFLVSLVLGGSLLFRSAAMMPAWARPLAAVGLVGFSVFIGVNFLANQFGFDREGFRAMVLSPMPRRSILAGKNLATLSVAAAVGTPLLLLGGIFLHLEPVDFAATVFQFITLLFVAALAGNTLSIWVPFRIAPGSLKPTKTTGMQMLVIVAFQLLFPLALVPAFAPILLQWAWRWADLPPAVPVSLLVSALFAALAALAYRSALSPLGRALQRRETQILLAVTQEVE
jgi:hypothetical protein